MNNQPKEIGLNLYYDKLRPHLQTGDLLLHKNWWLVELFYKYSHGAGVLLLDEFKETKNRVVLVEMFNKKHALPELELNAASERIMHKKAYWLPAFLNKEEQKRFKGKALELQIQDTEYHWGTFLRKAIGHGSWYYDLQTSHKKFICFALYAYLYCYAKQIDLPKHPPVGEELIKLIGMCNPVRIYKRRNNDEKK